MAIYAELFDGTRLEFPDGTDPSVIQTTAEKLTLERQPKPESGVGTTAADVGKSLASGAVSYIAGVPKGAQTAAAGAAREVGFAPQDILEYLADPTKITNKLTSLIGLDKQLEEQKNLVPEGTRKKEEIALDETLTKGKIQALENLSQAGKKVAGSIEKTISPEMQRAMQESIPEGNLPKELDKALATGDFSNVNFGKAPSLQGYLGLGAKVIGSSLPALISGSVTKSPTVAGIVGGAGAASEAKDTAKEHVSKQSNEELAKSSPYFKELLAQGIDVNKAREMTIDKSGDVAGAYQALVAGLGSAFTSKLFMGQLNPKVVASVKDRLYNATKGGLKGIGEESSQEYFEGIATDVGINKTVVRELGVDSFANLLLGALGGAGPGVIGGLRGETKAEAKTPEFIVDEKGNLVPADKISTTSTLPASTSLITTGAQQDLFAKEEAPYQVTPGERVAQTQGGQTIIEPIVDAEVKAKQEASDIAQAQIAELQQKLTTTTNKNEMLALRDQISKLESQVQQGPGKTRDILAQEHTTLERAKNELQQTAQQLTTQRDATAQLVGPEGKEGITQKLNAVTEQLAQIEARQQELLTEGKKITKQIAAEEAAIPEQGALEFQVSPIVDDKVLDGFGFTKKATKIKDQLRDLDMNKPEDREKLLDQVAKHERKGAKVDMQAVEDYVNNFTQPQEAPNVPRPVVSGAIPGGSQPSVPVPSGAVTPTQATAAPIAGRMAGNIPIAGGVDAGEAGVPAQGTATVAPTTQAVPITSPTAVSTTQATPALANEGKQILNSLRSAGGVTKPKATFKFPWFKKETDRVDTDFKNNSLFGELKSGFINIFSFDDAYNNLLRRGLFKLSDQEKITEEEAILALRRSDVTQVVHRGQLATEAINTGELVYDPKTNRYHVEANPDNMGALKKQIIALSKRVGISVDDALASISKAFEAGRINEIYGTLNKTSAELTRTEKKIASLRAIKKRTKAEEKELNTKEKLLINLKKDKQSYIDQVQHMTRAEAQKGMELFKVPEIAEGARIWQVMRKRTIKELVRSGVTSEDNAERWLSHMAYVPFFRDLGEERGVGMQIMRKGLGESMTEYGFDGSMLPVSNTIGNLYQWMHWSYARAISNQHMRVAKDQLQAVFPDIIKTGTGAVGKTFTVYEDGQRKEYTVANAAVAKMFLETGSILFPSITIANKYKDLFTKTITRIPGFSTAQLLLRDTWEALHSSGVKNPYGILKNVFFEIGKTALGISEARKELMSRGQLSTREHSMASQYESEMSQRLELKDPSYYRKAMNMLDKFSALNDNMLRQAVYQQLINEGVSKDEAADRATEIFNYRRSSGSSIVQTLNNVIPFLNAFGVSSRVAYRTVSGKGITAQTRLQGAKTLFTTSALMTAGTLMYLMAVGDSDEYKKMNRLHRDKSFLIPGTNFTLPLREGWFMMDKLVAEYVYNLLVNSATTDTQMFKDALARSIKKQFEPPIGGVIVAPIGLAMNRDIFNNKDIVNKTQERLESPYQMNKNTSELAKLLGDAGDISPLKLDYFFNSFFGMTMPATAWLTNEAIAEARGVPRPSQSSWDKFASIPTVGGFMPKENTSGNAADFYAAARETDKVLATIKHIAVTDVSKARAKIEEASPTLVRTEGIKNAIEGLNKQESIIRNMPAMIRNEQGELVPNMFQNNVPVTSESKQAEIKKIEERRKELTGGIMAIRKKVFQ